MLSIAKKILERRFVRFLLVGGLNTIFGYGIFALLIYFGMHYSLAALFGTILGILFNFQTIGRLVFAQYGHGLIFRFVAVYGLTYLLNLFGLYLFNLAEVSNYLAGAILIIPMALVAYYLNKSFVFSETRP
jgi:putative flippase GtrA